MEKESWWPTKNVDFTWKGIFLYFLLIKYLTNSILLHRNIYNNILMQICY